MRNDLGIAAAPEFAEELLAQQKSALVATWLQAGRVMTTRDVALELAITIRGAGYLLDKLSNVLPIFQDAGGGWRWVGDGEE